MSIRPLLAKFSKRVVEWRNGGRHFLAKLSKRVGIGGMEAAFLAKFSKRVGLGRNGGRPFLAEAKFYILYLCYGLISNSTDHAVTPFFPESRSQRVDVLYMAKRGSVLKKRHRPHFLTKYRNY